MRASRRLTNLLRIGAIWFAGTVVLGLLLAATAPLLIGDNSYVVRSGSMTPAISTGDLIVTGPIAPLAARVGQIVTFKDPDGSGRLLSHRVRAVHRVGDQVSFITQGDANTGQENWSVPVDGHMGHVLYRIPKLGYALVWIQSKPGRIGLIIVPAVLLVGFTLSRIWRPRHPEERHDASTT
jgi:signal peptidase